jgi:hypothetical protein
VARPEPTEMIEQHLLPLFAGRMGPSDQACLVSALLYVKDHLAEYEKKDRTLARLKQGLLLKAGPGGPLVKPAELYVGAEYGNANDLEKLFEGIGGVRFASVDYLGSSLRRLAKPAGDAGPSDAQRRREAKAWREFLVRLGVGEWPRVAVQPATATAPARAWSDDLRKVFDTRERDRVAHAFGLLDRRWAEYMKLLSVPERRRSWAGQPPPANVPSEFSRLLATAGWVPVKGGGLARPADAFVDTPANRQLLGDDVAYLDAPVRSRQLLDDLGIRREPDTAAALARLKALAEEGTCDREELARLYGFLSRRFAADGEAIAKAFADEPLVCVPGPPARYLRSGETFWEDVPPGFGDGCGGLGRHWLGLEGFFVHRLGIRRSPSAEDYGRVLRELASIGEPDAARERRLWDVYEGLGLALAREGVTGAGGLPAWWEELIRRPVFLADRGGFRANDGSLFVNDSDELYEVFRGPPGVWFLKLPRNDYPRFHRLIEAARLPLLSRSVKVEAVAPADRTQDAEMTARVRAAVPFLIRYLYFKEPAIYRSLKGAGMLGRLGELSVYACGEVLASASLNGVSVPLVRSFCGPELPRARDCLSEEEPFRVEETGMKTVTDLLTDTAADIKTLAKTLLLDHSRLVKEEWEPGFFGFAGNHEWQPLSDEAARLRSKLREDYARFHDLLVCLIRSQPRPALDTLRQTSAIATELIDQSGATWTTSVTMAADEFEKAINEQVRLLAALYDGAEGEHVYVPDTNALVHNPQLEDWRFAGSPRFVLLLAPTVLSELDQLKITGRVESVRDKAQRLVRQMMEYRRRGNLNEGVVLRKDSHRLRTLAVEPDFKDTLPWLDPSNNDDRILAGFVEVMRQHPRCPVFLVTGDINLTNKADYAKVPCVSPPDPPKAATT